jgi:nucleoside-diphosphate-sugar epimerase
MRYGLRKRVLVTGGAGFLGARLCVDMDEAGAFQRVADHHPGHAGELASTLQRGSKGGRSAPGGVAETMIKDLSGECGLASSQVSERDEPRPR